MKGSSCSPIEKYVWPIPDLHQPHVIKCIREPHSFHKPSIARPLIIGSHSLKVIQALYTRFTIHGGSQAFPSEILNFFVTDITVIAKVVGRGEGGRRVAPYFRLKQRRLLLGSLWITRQEHLRIRLLFWPIWTYEYIQFTKISLDLLKVRIFSYNIICD